MVATNGDLITDRIRQVCEGNITMDLLKDLGLKGAIAPFVALILIM